MNKVLNKYIQLPAPAKASFWFIISGFLQKGISLITTPVFTRIMTEEAYGLYSAYHSWLNIFTIIASLNLSAGVYTRGLVKNDGDEDAFSSSMLWLSTTCIAVVFIVCMLFNKVISSFTQLSTFLLIVMFVEIWATTVFHFWSNKERVNYRYKKLVVLTLLYVLFSQLIPILAIYRIDKGFQVETRALSVALVGFVLFLPLFISIVKKGKLFFSGKYWKYALLFNLPLVPHYLSQIVLNESDRIMIKSLCGANYTGYYSVAYSLAMVMLIFNNSVSGVMNPWIYKSIKSGNYQKIGKMSYSILVAIAVINFLLITVAPEALTIIAPRSYQQALWVIPPVTASVYFMFLYNLFATFEYYFEKTQYVMISSLLCAIVNIVLNYIFISAYGFIAAGYTTLVCNVLVSMLHYFFMRKTCKLYMDNIKVYNLGAILAIGLIFVAACAGMMLLYSLWFVRYGLLVAICILGIIFKNRIIKIFIELKKK